MKTTTETIIGPKQCKYRWRGTNLAEMRRAPLSKIAKTLGIEGDMSKNTMLTRMLTKLDTMEAEPELTDMLDG